MMPGSVKIPERWVTFLKVIFPIAIFFSVAAILGMVLEEDTWNNLWPLMIAYFFPPLGKETIIPAGIFGKEIIIPVMNWHIRVIPINPLLMALSIAFIDIIVALFLVWNYDLAKKIPFLGKLMIKVEEKGKRSVKKYGWIKPLRFIGIVLFVMIPFQGSGGVVASIVGRIIGMPPWRAWFAIVIGAILGCLLIAYSANTIFWIFKQNLIIGIILIAVIIVTGIIFWLKRKTALGQKSNKNK